MKDAIDINPNKDSFVNLDKLKIFFYQHFKLILFITLLFALIIRLKYMTVNAALWWDEADYMSLAKHYGLGLPEQAAPWRSRALSMVLGIFYFFGANEWFMRVLWTLASVAGVYMTYKIGKQLYNKLIGLIAAIGLAVYFEFIFWTVRFSADVFVLLIWTSIAYLFWKGYVQKQGNKYLYIAAALLGFGVFAYESLAFLFLVIFLFLVLTEKFSFLKKKEIWIALGIAFLVMLPFFIYNQVEFGNVYPRLWHQAGEFNPDSADRIHDWDRPSGEIVSDLLMYSANFPYYLKWPFMIAFAIGLLSFTNLFLGFDLVLKGKSTKLKKDLFIFIWAIVVLVLFSLIMAFTGFYFEPRFLFPIMPVVFIIVAKGFIKTYDYLKQYNKQIALLLVLILLFLGIYLQLSFANKLILAKKDSYAAENLAGTWLKEHTEPGEAIIGCGQSVQIIYYSERIFYRFNDKNPAEYLISEYNPRYFVMDGHDPGCSEVLNYPNQHPERYRPVKVFYLDEAQTQPIMVIYEIIYMQNT